jgi:Protein of unknown function (DUF1552)
MKPNRRHFLRAAGVSLALPWLESLAPARAANGSTAGPPRRMVCICTPLGLHPPDFFPEKAGKDYPLSPYLKVLEDYRNDFTVVSGLSHPDVGPSHDSIYSFLTGAPHPELRAGFRNTISLDQFAANRIGGETRFGSLALSCEGFSLSWTSSGAIVPSNSWPSSVFAQLFLQGRPEEGDRLLDRTMVFFSSNLGNASTHATRNLPILLAGGGFKHGQHLAFDASKGPPVCNLYVSMLQRLGVKAERFGSGTGTLRGLEIAQ